MGASKTKTAGVVAKPKKGKTKAATQKPPAKKAAAAKAKRRG